MKNIYPAINEEQSEINLTPMLDVVFIMLILQSSFDANRKD